MIAWSSAGGIGFKGSRKGTPFAATQAAINAGNAAKTLGMRSVDVRVKGPGSGRESAIRALQTVGTRSEVDPRRDADSAQRLPAAEAATRVARLGLMLVVWSDLTSPMRVACRISELKRQN